MTTIEWVELTVEEVHQWFERIVGFRRDGITLRRLVQRHLTTSFDVRQQIAHFFHAHRYLWLQTALASYFLIKENNNNK